MLGLLSKVFDSNDRELKKLWPTVEEINSLEKKVKKLKDKDFASKTQIFKKKVQNGENLFIFLPESFALVREATRRTLGMRHYDEQLLAAIVLAQGRVAEQKTGEGKTLSAVPALYLHALTGNPSHLVTVNDYLAKRDAGWMGMIFDFLGMTTSSLVSQEAYMFDREYRDESVNDYRLINLKKVSRKEAYECDIVYGINSEFGFDYLRDNMAFDKDRIVQTGHNFAVVDEVDSVLIDEARTPHIISAPDATPSQKYYEYSKIVDNLREDTDYQIDEKLNTAHLTEHGVAKLEKLYGVKDMYVKDYDTVYHVEAALKAKTLHQKNKDYIVRDNQVILVDEFTGRLMEGRRLSGGLHQAIEAKEGVPVQRESKTLATVSLQNYFRMYDTLAGMTGTAVTEAEEFSKIYELDVVSVPTHRETQREDEQDKIYKTTRGKVKAIVDEIEDAYKKGQPVLVGTTSIEKNEIVSKYLKSRNISHQVLNAKNHTREALVISDAGKKGAVTVATNMAGRGVDIILGGQPPSSFETEYQTEKGKKKLEKELKDWQKEHDQVIKLGGLLVIGTEKHESRRIDNQLRGRAGRQGDPGRSVFIVSLEDDLMRVFGGEQIANLMTRFNFPEDQPLTHALVTRVLKQAQVKVEGFHFESRKHTVDYDDVLNKQREIIYKLRRSIVEEKEDIKEFVYEKIEQIIDRVATSNIEVSVEENPKKNIIDEFAAIVPFDENSQKQLLKQIEQKQNANEITDFLTDIAKKTDQKRREQFDEEEIDKIFKFVSLSAIDSLWADHLTAMDDLRSGVRLRGYAQKDPLVEYKNEAFTKFEELIASIDDYIVHRVFRINPAQAPQVVQAQPKEAITNEGAAQTSAVTATTQDTQTTKQTKTVSTSGAPQTQNNTKKKEKRKAQKKKRKKARAQRKRQKKKK